MDARAERPPAGRSTGTWIGMATVGLFMVLPVVVIGEEFQAVAAETASPIAMSATAALGALFRASARNLFRGTLFTAARATSRAATRRFTRRLLQVGGAFLLPDAAQLGMEHRTERWALWVGGVAMASSCAAVVALRSAELGVPIAGLAALAVLPMLVHFGVLGVLGRALGVRVTYSASADGLLLQGYFSAAGSFLPLCVDAHLEGPVDARARVAGLTIGSLWTVSVALGLVHGVGRDPWVAAAMSFFLIYTFVFSFPVAPLQGGDLYERSRLAWCAAFALVLAAFAALLPEAWYGIL